MSKELPQQARVVIIGGGVVGCSTAYHLTKLGWKDVVLLERKQLTCGTTWHAAGLVGQLRATMNLTRLAQYTAGLYETLEEETGQATGFMQRGSIAVATHKERMEELLRGASMAKTFGLEVETMGPDEIKSMWPLVNTDGVVGGVFLPKDGQCNPTDTTQALAKGARMGGATILENVKVTEILTKNGRAVGVSTDQGDIEAEYVVNCGGMWGRELGHSVGVNTPLHACEHFYIVTEPIAELTNTLPVMRIPDECAYYKEDAGKLLLGAFEPGSKPWGMDGIPEDFCFDELPEDVDHFAPVLEAAMNRLPILESSGIRTFFNGPESFTPDNAYLLGEAPELKNFFMACGFNSIGIQSAGGAGKVLSEWIVEGYAPMDLWDVDVRRMMPFQGNSTYLRERVSETLGLLYDMHWPFRQHETARGARKSILHDRLAAHGACFGSVAGWERPNWFAPKGVEPKYEYSYKRQNWFEYAAAEHMAVRENVGMFDMSSFAKFLVQGRDAEAVLQRICSNNVAVKPGRVVYTQWLNERGGIEADLTVTRLAEDRYQIVTAGASAVRDMDWLKRHIPDDAHVFVTDITSGLTVLPVMGPNARALLQKITDADLSHGGFPFATAREIEIGYAQLLAQRITYVGELGWELYIPTEFAPDVFDRIMAAGEEFGLKLCGLHVLDSCRIEKAFRHFGHDITDEDTPVEAGLMFACAMEKSIPFIGKEAVLRQKGEGVPKKRMLQFLLQDPEPLLYHNEPILRDGEIVGRVTSGNYGHALGGAVGMGYINGPDGVTMDYVKSGKFEIEVAGERFPAKASLQPLYDPKAERVKI